MLGFLKGSVSFWCIRSDPIFSRSVLNLCTLWAIFPSVLSLTGSCSKSGRSSSIFSVVPLCLLISRSSYSTGIHCFSAYTIYSAFFFLNCSLFCRFIFPFYTVEEIDVWVCDVNTIALSDSIRSSCIWCMYRRFHCIIIAYISLIRC